MGFVTILKMVAAISMRTVMGCAIIMMDIIRAGPVKIRAAAVMAEIVRMAMGTEADVIGHKGF